MKHRAIKHRVKAKQINMGGVVLDQALPIQNIDYIDPFLLIHHWKQVYKGGEQQENLGVGPHPHRGFAPVTLIFEGGIFHQDSIGNKSLIEKGGTQWMNSGKGIVHSERPSKQLAEHGGTMEIIQFWVNAPKKNKMDPPKYQPLTAEEMPSIISDGGLIKIGIVAGEYAETEGIIQSYSELLILRMEISKSGKIDIPIPEDFNALIYQLDGKLRMNNHTMTDEKNMTVFGNNGNIVELEGLEDTRAILLAGKPINEEMVSYGPFVMNSKQEIQEAMNDFQTGKMGKLIESFT